MNHSNVKKWSNKAQYFHKSQKNSIAVKDILHMGDSSWVTSISSTANNQRIASLQLLLKWITGLICLFKIRNFTGIIMHWKFALCFVSHESHWSMNSPLRSFSVHWDSFWNFIFSTSWPPKVWFIKIYHLLYARPFGMKASLAILQ